MQTISTNQSPEIPRDFVFSGGDSGYADSCLDSEMSPANLEYILNFASHIVQKQVEEYKKKYDKHIDELTAENTRLKVDNERLQEEKKYSDKANLRLLTEREKLVEENEELKKAVAKGGGTQQKPAIDALLKTARAKGILFHYIALGEGVQTESCLENNIKRKDAEDILAKLFGTPPTTMDGVLTPNLYSRNDRKIISSLSDVIGPLLPETAKRMKADLEIAEGLG